MIAVLCSDHPSQNVLSIFWRQKVEQKTATIKARLTIHLVGDDSVSRPCRADRGLHRTL
jgi:hypothetical protein